MTANRYLISAMGDILVDGLPFAVGLPGVGVDPWRLDDCINYSLAEFVANLYPECPQCHWFQVDIHSLSRPDRCMAMVWRLPRLFRPTVSYGDDATRFVCAFGVNSPHRVFRELHENFVDCVQGGSSEGWIWIDGLIRLGLEQHSDLGFWPVVDSDFYDTNR